LRTEPGDYIFVPPWVPLARSTQDAVVVNLSSPADFVERQVGPVASPGAYRENFRRIGG
jgi:hypothetical protein